MTTIPAGNISIVSTFLREAKKTLSLALPMIIGQLGILALGAADRIMVGHLEEGAVEAVAAVGFDTMITLWLLIIGMGLCSSVHVLVAQSVGSTKQQEASEALKHGIWVILAYTMSLALIIHFGIDLLYLLKQPPEIVVVAQPYIKFMAWSMIPGLVFRSFRNYLEAWNNPWTPFYVTAFVVLLNVFFNWVFIFGRLGAPAMGVCGAGLATLLARCSGLVILVGYIVRSSKYQLGWDWFGGFFKCSWRRFKRVLTIGGATSFQIAFEFGSISMATIMMGWLGAHAMAAQQVAQSYTSFLFMVPLGVSFAITIRVGEAIGRNDRMAVRCIGFCGTALGAAFMVWAGIFSFALRDAIPYLFIKDQEVMALATQLLLIAAMTQFWDGIQVVCMGALRGMADVKVPTVVVICSYWLIGLSSGYTLAFVLKLGAIGIWLGLMLGLIVAAVFLFLRFNKATSRNAEYSESEGVLGF